MTWHDVINQVDANGNPTPLALALQALAADGCHCYHAEDNSCVACRCEAALRSLFDSNTALRERCMALDGALQRVRERVSGLPQYHSESLALGECIEVELDHALEILDEEVRW